MRHASSACVLVFIDGWGAQGFIGVRCGSGRGGKESAWLAWGGAERTGGGNECGASYAGKEIGKGLKSVHEFIVGLGVHRAMPCGALYCSGIRHILGASNFEQHAGFVPVQALHASFTTVV